MILGKVPVYNDVVIKEWWWWGGEIIEKVETYTYLGITIDDKTVVEIEY